MHGEGSPYDSATASAHLMADVLAYLPVAIVQLLVHPQRGTEVRFASPGTEPILGLHPEAIQRDPAVLGRLVHPEDLDAVTASWTRASAENHVWKSTYRIRRPDGEVRWVLGSGRPRQRSDGSTVWNTMTIDITAQVEADQRAARDRLKFQAVFDAAMPFFWVLDAEGAVQGVNQTAQEELGHRADGRRFADQWPVEDSVRARLHAAALRPDGISYEQIRIPGPGGRDRAIALTFKRVTDRAGDGVVVEGRDVTHELERDALLQIAELSNIVAHLGAFTVTDDRVRLSASANEILGGEAEEAVVPVDAILGRLDPTGSRRMKAALQRLRDEGGDWETEADLVGPGGTRRAHLWLRGGGEQGVVGAIQDVTQQHQQREAVQHAARLESIGRLAGGVAHDFNNVLTTIIGSADLLASVSTGEEAVFVQEIHMAAERGRAMTQKLLVLARPQDPARRVVDIGQLVGESAPLWKRMLGEGIDLTLDLGMQPMRADVDPRQIDQVLMNLLVNARDAGCGQVRISLRPQMLDRDGEAQAGGLIVVQDDGAGMSSEARARAFEPFFTTKGPSQGTGLGLATSYVVAKQNGGELRILATDQRGTQFGLWLPLAEGQLAPAPTRSRPRPASWPGRVALLVEDDEAASLVVRRLLERMGFDVRSLRRSVDALDLNDPPDLLVTDVVMPEISGPRLATSLRIRWPQLPVLFISGYPGDELRRHGWEEDAPLLVKPFTSQELTEMVHSVLSGGPSIP
jgi:PAS domain S-box-containing protein